MICGRVQKLTFAGVGGEALEHCGERGADGAVGAVLERERVLHGEYGDARAWRHCVDGVLADGQHDDRCAPVGEVRREAVHVLERDARLVHDVEEVLCGVARAQQRVQLGAAARRSGSYRATDVPVCAGVFYHSKVALAICSGPCYNTAAKPNRVSSGQGEIPDRRYSPRTSFTGPNRCDSDTDSIVWMEGDALSLRLRKIAPGGDILSGVYFSEVFLWTQ